MKTEAQTSDALNPKMQIPALHHMHAGTMDKPLEPWIKNRGNVTGQTLVRPSEPI
jgi:hypothetical protein